MLETSGRVNTPRSIEETIMAKDMKKGLGNGLGSNKVKSWNPGSMRDYSFKGPGQGKVASHNRPGAGQKGSK